jgi:peptide deformylase
MKILHYSTIRPCTKDVSVFDTNLLSIKEEMISLCLETEGIGLAASQVALNERLFVFLSEENVWNLVCNPKMTPKKEAGLVLNVEACLSVPNESFKIRRWSMVDATWYDETGTLVEKTLSGRDAQVFQHEYDHLVARSIVDRFKGQYRSGRFEAGRTRAKGRK